MLLSFVLHTLNVGCPVFISPRRFSASRLCSEAGPWFLRFPADVKSQVAELADSPPESDPSEKVKRWLHFENQNSQDSPHHHHFCQSQTNLVDNFKLNFALEENYPGNNQIALDPPN